MDSHRLPKRTTMVCRIKELLSHNVKVIFPPGCLDIVSNLITDYWEMLRTKIHNTCSNRFLQVAFKPNVKEFRDHHTMSMREGQTLQLENSVLAARLFFKSVMDGTQTKTHMNKVVPNRQTPKHKMFCLTIPQADDLDYGMAMEDAHLKDADGVAFDNIVIFNH
jgi:regulator of replication initiation timing